MDCNFSVKWEAKSTLESKGEMWGGHVEERGVWGAGVGESEDREHTWIVGQTLGPETLRIQMIESTN